MLGPKYILERSGLNILSKNTSIFTPSIFLKYFCLKLDAEKN